MLHLQAGAQFGFAAVFLLVALVALHQLAPIATIRYNLTWLHTAAQAGWILVRASKS